MLVLPRAMGLCALALGVAADQSITAAGVTVQVRGQSGKMTLSIPGNDTANPDEVWVQMAALRQVDSSGIVLGGGGSDKHSFNSFATQSFTFGPPTQSTYQGLSVAEIEFNSIMVGSSNLTIKTFIFKESGSLTVGLDTLNVTAGTIKFNVQLSSWSWCGENGVTCKSAAGTGAAVELDIDMYKKGASSPKSKGDGKYDLGGGQQLVMLSTYSGDAGATWTPMPAGYPSLSGSKFTLKFPKWSNEAVIYDPIVQYSGAATTAAGTTQVTTTGKGNTAIVSAATHASITFVFLALLSFEMLAYDF